MAEPELDAGGFKRTLKDLFAGAAGGVAQVLLGQYFLCAERTRNEMLFAYVAWASEFWEFWLKFPLVLDIFSPTDIEGVLLRRLQFPTCLSRSAS